MVSDGEAEIQIKGKIDLTKLKAQDNGLVEGQGTGEMKMIIKAEGQQIMKVEVHKLSFEGMKSVVDPDKYPGSNEKSD